MNPWERVVPEAQRQLFEKGGWGGRLQLGDRPGILVVDALYDFVGDRPEPIEQSRKRWPLSCGQKGWEAISHLQDLLEVARAQDVTVMYSSRSSPEEISTGGMWDQKTAHESEDGDNPARKGQIVDEVAPLEGEVVFSKTKPSCFFGTPLESLLNEHRVDSLIVTGATTSGCIRATVVDAFSYNYPTFVPYECVWDRASLCHDAALYVIDQKYGDVVLKEQVLKQLNSSA